MIGFLAAVFGIGLGIWVFLIIIGLLGELRDGRPSEPLVWLTDGCLIVFAAVIVIGLGVVLVRQLA